MKVTVVGFWGGYPGVNSATSGYIFESDDFQLLVDCGSGVLAQLQNYTEPTNLNAVILSHYHHDHVADIGPLQFARLIATFLGKGTETLPIYGHGDDKEAFEKLTHKNITKSMDYNPNEILHIGPFSIEFLKTAHPVVCYAMKIKTGDATVVYTADSSYLDSFIPFTKDADLFICECNFYAAQDGKGAGHMNSHDAAKIAKEANVQKLLLTHLPHFGEHEQLVTEAKTLYDGEVSLAHAGLVWEKGTI
ncbi:MBL fold metallo-hydrolase [Bacillus alkalisoli]|uniref:MBL fold metallo-hydrolase n=1 Tax=Bacillus alkalisoli TaxID=2011008 RepID=UPI000C24D6B1|nr:MBL fold metallo-hydrolase [Bacillus alkalisoli]